MAGALSTRRNRGAAALQSLPGTVCDTESEPIRMEAATTSADVTPLTCPTAEIPPASVHKSTVAARFRSMAVWVSRRSIQLSEVSLVDFVRRYGEFQF